MSDVGEGPVEVAVGGTRLVVSLAPPSSAGIMRQHADLAEDFPVAGDTAIDGYFFVALTEDADEWPRLVVTQRYAPCGPGFPPGVLYVPENRVLFIGAGTRLLAYHERSGRWHRSWSDHAECGFWAWRQHDDIVVMSAELEMAAWNTAGTKLWTTFVEPPWSYRVDTGRVFLDVMGAERSFDLVTGP